MAHPLTTSYRVRVNSFLMSKFMYISFNLLHYIYVLVFHTVNIFFLFRRDAMESEVVSCRIRDLILSDSLANAL